MLFSSPVFLCLFLPLTLLGYYLCIKPLKNYWLLFASLIFFAWGGVSFTLILAGSILLNYLFGLQVQNHLQSKAGYRWLFVGVSSNIIILVVFKYTNFFTHCANLISERLSLPPVTETNIILPIGISFYTFHSLSYLVDIYRGKTPAQKNIFNLALYISMFSQLIAGPIIRYSDVWYQLTNREHSLAKFSSGVERFLIGLGKKVLLANTFARVADTLFNTHPQQLGALNAWLGIICYTLQIYCDFSGYSDMAIGLGRMFGFEFMENFNFPYLARSVKEFWRRWHISLSTFFRDYVYIPLGGNRVKKSRQYVNLVAVFFITGLWHGANWTFVAWGLFHGFFLLMERLFLEKFLEKAWSPLTHIYTILVIMFAWVLFRNPYLGTTLNYWREMFDLNVSGERMNLFMSFMNRELYFALIIAIAGSLGFFSFLGKHVYRLISADSTTGGSIAILYHVGSALFYICVFVLCSLYLISGTYNPFIYYKF